MGFLGGFSEVPDFAVARRDERRRAVPEGNIRGYGDQGFGAITLCQRVAYPATWRDLCNKKAKIWQLSQVQPGSTVYLSRGRFSDVSLLIRFALRSYL